jgi:hypothetical protein
MSTSKKNIYTQKQFEQDLNQLEKLISKGGNKNSYNDDSDEDSYDEESYQQGGAKDYAGSYRNFKIVELNGKAVKYDSSAAIKENQTPLNAAKKLLKSICLQMGLKGMKKLECHATYVIQETTRGSKKKMFGPYKGKYSKYTPEEAKKATASGISFKMKPVVKLHKHSSPKKSPMKGGVSRCKYCFKECTGSSGTCSCGGTCENAMY